MHRIFLLFCVLSLSSCATVSRIPGLDRIFYDSSKAEVGPIFTESGELVEGTSPVINAAAASSDDKSEQGQVLAEPAIEPPSADKAPDSSRPQADLQVRTSVSGETKLSDTAPVQTQVKDETKAQLKESVEQITSVAEASYSDLIAKKTIEKRFTLKGKVTMLGKSGVISPEGLIVRLIPLDGQKLEHRTVSETHDVAMFKKVYRPGSLVIRKGDALNFPNNDAIQHNVFSTSGANAFDLGTYGGGLQRSVRLNEEGIVKVYCNIHPKMAAFIAIDDLEQSQVISDEEGLYSFTGLPAGNYKLKLWSIRGEMSQELVLKNQSEVTLDISFDTSNYKNQLHSNKYGEKYKKNRVRGEFY